MRERDSYHHGDLKTALLDAGDNVLQERGLQGFTLRECARRAGVSHAAPKHHFGSAEGFLTAVASRGFERLTQALTAGLATSGADLGEQFYATAQAYVGYALAWPEHFRIMFRSDLLDAQSPLIRCSARETFIVLTNVVLRQRNEVEFTAEDFTSAAFSPELIDDIVVAWSHIHGYAHLRLEQQLNMFDSGTHEQVLRSAALRLSTLLHDDATHDG